MPTQHRHRRRILLLALFVLVLLAGSGVAVAQWMARASNPANTFTAGRMELEDSLPGGPILGGAGLAPGSLVTGTVTITNGSTMPVSITLGTAARAPSTSNLTGVLQLALRECGPDCTTGAAIYLGPLSGLSGTRVPGKGAGGAWAPHEVHRYLFSVTLPLTASAALMGSTASVDFLWTATSAA